MTLAVLFRLGEKKKKKWHSGVSRINNIASMKLRIWISLCQIALKTAVLNLLLCQRAGIELALPGCRFIRLYVYETFANIWCHELTNTRTCMINDTGSRITLKILCRARGVFLVSWIPLAQSILNTWSRKIPDVLSFGTSVFPSAFLLKTTLLMFLMTFLCLLTQACVLSM